MRRFVNAWEATVRDIRVAGQLEQIPALSKSARDAAEAMIQNLDLYMEFDSVQNAWAEFSRRHEQIMNFINMNMMPGLFFLFPELYSAFMVYKFVAPVRMQAAKPRIEEPDGEDELDNDMNPIDEEADEDVELEEGA